MDMNLDEAIKILTEEYPAHLKEKAIKVIYRLVEESAYYRDLVKLERKEKEQLKKSLKGQIKKKDTEIIEAKETNRQLSLELEKKNKRISDLEYALMDMVLQFADENKDSIGTMGLSALEIAFNELDFDNPMSIKEVHKRYKKLAQKYYK